MFRVTFFCDDRKLGDCLRSLTGIAIGPPEVVPVVNAEKDTNGLKQASNGSISAMFTQWIAKRKLTEIRATDAKEFLQSIGRSPASATYTLKKLVKDGVLKQVGKGTATSYRTAPKTKSSSQARK